MDANLIIGMPGETMDDIDEGILYLKPSMSTGSAFTLQHPYLAVNYLINAWMRDLLT